jgi:hypothetical protein
MSSINSQVPILRRSRVTLNEDKVIQSISSPDAPRIVRAGRPTLTSVDLSEKVSPVPPTGHSPVIHRPGRLQSAPVLSQSPAPHTDGATVMVINASLELARELTVELSQALPGCSILFAPTLSTALWMLKRRSIDIILSSSILPDGPLGKLHEVLELMTPPPELVVLSELGTTRSEMDSHPGYRFVELRRFNQLAQSQDDAPTEEIRTLGADIRNDLNNPLQEIVAMAFVAQASQGLSPAADQALAAIERAAGNMASVVEGIEDKIRTLVQRSAA